MKTLFIIVLSLLSISGFSQADIVKREIKVDSLKARVSNLWIFGPTIFDQSLIKAGNDTLILRSELADTAAAIRANIGSGGVTPTDGILHWNSVTNKYEPYSTQQAFLSFDASTTAPNLTTRINLNGNLYANYLRTTSGIYGEHTGLGNGVYGLSSNASYSGVYGKNDYGTGITGYSNYSKAGVFIQNGSIASTNVSANLFELTRSLSATSGNISGNIINILDNSTTSGSISGSILRATIGSTVRINLNPRVSDLSTSIAYLLDTHNVLSAQGAKLMSVKNNGTEKFSIDKDGKLTALQYFVSSLNTAPSSATDTGTAGEIRICSDYIYVCIATDTWVRTALTTW